MVLEASTFPFIAFIALQPRRSRSRGAVISHPAVLSRLEGSPQSVLAASAITAHIHDVLLPRTRAYLSSLRREQHDRELSRQLKAEQDRAYEETSRRDQERVIQRRAEVARKEQQAVQVAAEAAAAAAQKNQAAQWRAWARRYLVPHEPDGNHMPIRVSVHLPDGRNLQRRFRAIDTLEAVYAFVDTVDADDTLSQQDTPPAGYVHTYKFTLVQTYPRRALSTDLLHTSLQNVNGFGPSANLVVEGGTEESSDEE